MNWKKQTRYQAAPRVVHGEARVHCNGRKHRIRWDGEAQKLLLLDHSKEELRRLRTLTHFGDACRCLTVARAWAEAREAPIPEGLREAFYVQRDVARRCRARQRTCSAPDPLAVKASQLHQTEYGYAYNMNLSGLYRAAGARLLERVAQGDYYPPNLCLTVNFDGSQHAVACWRYMHFILPELRTRSYATLMLPRHWPLHVEAAGLAVVDNALILDVWSPRRHDLFVEHVARIRRRHGGTLPRDVVAGLRRHVPYWLNLSDTGGVDANDDVIRLESGMVRAESIPAMALLIRPTQLRYDGAAPGSSREIIIRNVTIENKEKLRL